MSGHGRQLVARLQTAPADEQALLDWLRERHVPAALAVPGVRAVVVYRAFRVEHPARVYEPVPRFSVLHELDPALDPTALADDDAFLSWWGESVATWSAWTTDHRWVVAEQELGPDTPPSYDRVLLTQVDVADGFEDAWARWYDARHVEMSLAIPGMYGPEMKRLRSRPVHGRLWHCAPSPRFTALLQLQPGADIAERMGTPEFTAAIADTQALFGGALELRNSTMCERVHEARA
ncbi:MAG TPA: hypothetical protein VFU94_03430 [Conexibacter sp.]|nr:hypothetical protein [Conexibacter sp.]